MRRAIAARCAGFWLTGLLALATGCGNNPYAEADPAVKIRFSPFATPHRTLDPAEAYNVTAHEVTGLVYDTLLEYHYLKRPYTLIPGLAKAVPEAEALGDGRVRYRFEIREGIGFGPDPCFGDDWAGASPRIAVASDFAFQLMRLADPALKVQVRDPFSRIEGFEAFHDALVAARAADPAFADQPPLAQYQAAGGIRGVRVDGDHALEVTLSEPYPQILYWFAMEFTTPVAHEAVAYYDGEGQRERYADHLVGTGPYQVIEYDKRSRIVLERNPNWYGIEQPDAPGAHYPTEGAPGDAEAGLLDAAYVGRPLPFIDRIEMRLDKESIPVFNKFLQGYYDAAGIIKESFDQVVQNDTLSPEMAARGITLRKALSPGLFYLAFNMEDSVVGAKGGERARKLRQAMSLAVDAERWIQIFLNGRGIPAQSPIPPVISGSPEGYENPYRRVDLARARLLLAEAGYADGIDPATGKPLRLTFDTYEVGSGGALDREYFIDEWRKLGVDVDLQVTTYNEFQAKVERLAYQVYLWGWSADYPDPENFLFLLTCDMRRSTNGGPNSSNFCDPEYDRLFDKMEILAAGEERDAVIRKMVAIVENERPWIELYNGVGYSLAHDWLRNVKPFGMSYPMSKYMDVDARVRAERRAEWNKPVVWPAWVLAGVFVVAVVPGIRTFFRERQ